MKIFLLSLVALINLYCYQSPNFQINIYPSEKLKIKYQQDWQKPLFNNRVNEFRNKPIGHNKIVFLGNSIIEAGNNWNEKLAVDNIINRGISGDFTEGVLARLDEIVYYKPLAVFLLIGINDIFDDHAKRKDITPRYVANNIKLIASTIKSKSKKSKIFIQTILPVDTARFMDFHNRILPVYKSSLNAQINQINQLIKDGMNEEYAIVDLHTLFIDERGLMNEKFTTDGVHLNDLGYSMWSNVIRNDILALNK
tara:strand:+ start:98 stop:856 length:759 start_codon:yes stop_codon:yes gene_type:complete